MTDQPRPAVTVRIVLWPTRGDADFTGTPLEDPLADASDVERDFFAAEYADVPLLDLWRRLRLAEWNADHYQREAAELRETVRRMPSLTLIQELDARHKRIRGLLAGPGRISRALLTAALAESDDVWNARTQPAA